MNLATVQHEVVRQRIDVLHAESKRLHFLVVRTESDARRHALSVRRREVDQEAVALALDAMLQQAMDTSVGRRR